MGSTLNAYSSSLLVVGEGSGRILSNSTNSPFAILDSSFSFIAGGVNGLLNVIGEVLMFWLLFTIPLLILSPCRNRGVVYPVIGCDACCGFRNKLF